MKRTLFLISVIFMFSCKSQYEQEEMKVITDFTNSYLKKEHFEKLENYKLICSENEKLDSTNLKIYISDYLLPISSIRKDKNWLFNGNYSGNDSIIFLKILNSKKFNELSYREFNESEIQLIENYNLIANYNQKEDYIGIKFSRVCLDEKKENAIVLIEYNFNCDKFNVTGFERPYLLKKMNSNWIYIPTK